MRISDYFRYIQTLRLSPLERVHMYQRFLDKMSRVVIWKRWVTYAKYTSATLGCAAFIILVSGYLTRNGSLYQLATENGIYTAYEKTPGSYAEAMTLGTILHAQGDIILSKDGQKMNANEIANGEKIILQEGASLEFLINQSTKATINGPAAFELQDLGQTSNMHDIAINLLYGDYLEVHTQQPDEQTTPTDIDEAASIADNIIIKTKNFEVKRLRSSDKLNLVIKKGKEDEHTIQNNGGELVVEKFIQDKKVFTSVKTEQLVAVGEDVTLLEDQAKLISKAITDQKISTNYSLDDQKAKTLSSEVNTASKASDTPADVVLLSSSKQVISEDQMKRLDTLLAPTQLMSSIEGVVVAYLNGTPANSQSSANALAMRIKSVYDTLGISLDSQVVSYYNKNNLSLKELTLSTDQLIAKMESNYYVGPTYTKRLKGILAWLLFLETAKPVSSHSTGVDGTTGATTPLTFDQLVEQYNLEKFQGYLLLK